MKRVKMLMTEWELMDQIYEDACRENPSQKWEEFHARVQEIDLARANKASIHGSRLPNSLAQRG